MTLANPIYQTLVLPGGGIENPDHRACGDKEFSVFHEMFEDFSFDAPGHRVRSHKVSSVEDLREVGRAFGDRHILNQKTILQFAQLNAVSKAYGREHESGALSEEAGQVAFHKRLSYSRVHQGEEPSTDFDGQVVCVNEFLPVVAVVDRRPPLNLGSSQKVADLKRDRF